MHLLFRSIDGPDTQTHQSQSAQTLQPGHLTTLTEQKGGQGHTKNWGHYTIDGHLRHRIIFEQDTPQGKRSRGDKSQIDQHQYAGYGVKYQPSSKGEADPTEDDAAQKKLIAADGNGILFLAIDPHQHGGQCVGGGGTDKESLSIPGKTAAQSAAGQVDENDAPKTQHTAQRLAGGKLLLSENKARDQDGDKAVGAADDAPLHPRGVGKADIIEDILDHRLDHGHHQHIAPGLTGGKQSFFPDQTAEYDTQHTCNGKAQSRVQQQCGDVGRVHPKQLIADLDAGKGTAPQEAAYHGSQKYPAGRG